MRNIHLKRGQIQLLTKIPIILAALFLVLFPFFFVYLISIEFIIDLKFSCTNGFDAFIFALSYSSNRIHSVNSSSLQLMGACISTVIIDVVL